MARRNEDPGLCVVTGGSQGIGQAIAGAFLHQTNCNVLIVDRVPPPSDVEIFCAAIKDKRLSYANVDVSDSEAFEDYMGSTFGGKDDPPVLECLVNNAGIFETEENDNVLWGESTTCQDVDRIIRTNLGGVVHGTRAAVRIMSRQSLRRGTIINIASTAALHPFPDHPVYCATKSAVLQFSQTADIDIKARGHDIRVFCVCPGIIDTEMGRMGGESNRRVVASLKGGQRTSPTLVADAVINLFQRKEEYVECSYLVVDNHEIRKILR